MKNEIDLSKAYIGQIVTFRNSETDILIDVCAQSDAMEKFDVYFSYHGYPHSKEYSKDGLRYPDEKFGFDIVSLSDPIQVQCARIEGEIKGMKRANEYAVRSMPEYFDALLAELETELLTLQNNQ